tara:strand:- start:238 stop:543 length:306 start_codon:yes stop_codon:yes gene_type:complete
VKYVSGFFAWSLKESYEPKPGNAYITIQGVKPSNQYKGRYQKIWKIIDGPGPVLYQREEAETSPGLIGKVYHLEVEGSIDQADRDQLQRIRGVKVVTTGND